MYTVYCDSQLLYSTDVNDPAFGLSSPNVTLNLNKAGSFTFTIYPSNVLYGSLKRLKSIITVYQDAQCLFRGRILSTTTDLYGTRKVTCEGCYAFLLDSVVPAGSMEGTLKEYFEYLIANHNAQMDLTKEFTTGTVDVGDNTKLQFKTDDVQNTRAAIESLVTTYGGHIETRFENGVLYIDWLKNVGTVSGQNIEFGVNMIDFSEDADANDIFTMLRPTSKSGLTIAGVDADHPSEYIKIPVPYEKYGPIVRGVTFDKVSTKLELLEQATKYISENYKAQPLTFTLTAVDMRLLGYDMDYLTVGKRIGVILPSQHVNMSPVCTSITYDLENPANNTYTFGEETNFQSSTSSSVVTTTAVSSGKTSGSGGITSVLDKYITVTDEKLLIQHAKMIELTVGQSDLKIQADRIESTVGTQGQQLTTLTQKTDSIEAKVTKNGEDITTIRADVDGFSATYVTKDGIASALNLNAQGVQIQAEKIDLSGYTTINKLETELANIDTLYVKVGSTNVQFAGNLVVNNSISANTITAHSLINIGGNKVATESWVAANFAPISS